MSINSLCLVAQVLSVMINHIEFDIDSDVIMMSLMTAGQAGPGAFQVVQGSKSSSSTTSSPTPSTTSTDSGIHVAGEEGGREGGRQ